MNYNGYFTSMSLRVIFPISCPIRLRHSTLTKPQIACIEQCLIILADYQFLSESQFISSCSRTVSHTSLSTCRAENTRDFIFLNFVAMILSFLSSTLQTLTDKPRENIREPKTAFLDKILESPGGIPETWQV